MKNNKDKIEKISEERKNYLSKVKNRKLTIILLTMSKKLYK